jgi:glutaconate CoA-transferase subunit B
MVFMKHERRRFVEHLDYLTSPGWLQGGISRQEAGLIRGGPVAVITTLGVLEFDERTKRMYLSTHYENASGKDIVRNTGFKLDVTRAKQEPSPTPDELDVLRTDVDPLGLILE